MRIILTVIALAALVVGAFYLGYHSETSDEDKDYAKQVMKSRTINSGGGISIGAYE